MKKKIIGFLLLLAMLADATGIIFLSCVPFSVKQRLLGVCLLAFILILLLVFFIKFQRFGSILADPHTDTLTGLGDKRSIKKHFEKVGSSARRYTCLAYIAADMKKVRLEMGDEKADELQKGVAKLLFSACGEFDSVSRLDDGVFVLSICCRDGLHSQQRINDITNRLNQYQNQLLMGLVAPFRTGISLPPEEKINFETAFSNAKIGYQYAFDNDINTFICTKELLIKKASQNRLRDKLLFALQSQQFEPYLQFIYSVESDKFVGAEVLSRWNDPEEGLLMPSYYINDMRETGVIEQFDYYMFDKVCKILQDWKGTEFENLLLSCNITRITISSDSFLKNIKAILKKYSFDHSRLIVEITEDALINDQLVAHDNIVACKQEGIRIAIDDFGTGNSSVNDISDFPVDQIKIDRKIVVQADTKRGKELLHSLIRLSHTLDIKVVCEGVETEKQRQNVVQGGCDYIQGYLFSYVFSLDEAKKHYLDSLK